MRRHVAAYVIAISILAVAALVGLIETSPINAADHLPAALSFAALGVLAQLLAHRLPNSAAGSIGFLPFLAAILVAPSWVPVAAISLSVAVVEVVRRRELLKAVFNVAQIALSLAVCCLLFVLLGGEPLESKADLSWGLVATFGASFLLFLIINSVAVNGVIGVSAGRSLAQMWRSTSRRSLVFDSLSFPFVFVFALGYTEYGFAGVSVLALQLLGVRQLYKTNWQLENTNKELLELMVAAIEARDPYTSGHSRRVSAFSTVIARAIGMSPKQIERVGVAALLHDVGKIHEVFAPILQKPSRLTAEETAIMQTHPIKSAELVQNVSQLRDVVLPVRHHHENWDGSGYPDGLRGEAIPITSRIIMFADTIDAMTTDRPYRAALGEAQVRSELLKLRGIQFDPHICDVLLSSPHFKSLFKQETKSVGERVTAKRAAAVPLVVNM